MWSACSKSCGGGNRTSNRTILQNAVNGGEECVGDAIKTESCNPQPCSGISYMIEIRDIR